MSTNKETIYIYVDHDERIPLFRALAEAFKLQGYRVIIVSNRLSAILFQERGTKCIPLKNEKTLSGSLPKETLESSIEVLLGIQTLEEATRISAQTIINAERILKKYGTGTLIIWNGSSTIAKTLTDQFRRSGGKTLYLELANIPGKIFADPDGVNAQSRLFHQCSYLDGEAGVSAKDWDHWLSNYKKTINSPPKQSLNRNKARGTYLFDWLGFVLGITINPAPRAKITDTLKKLRTKKTATANHPDEPPNKPFTFFPLQVSNDTQIWINSEIDNLQALKYAIDLASKTGTELVVKIHPAEPCNAFIEEVLEASSLHGFEVTICGTGDLIENSAAVVTINSTVGLQAMILGKPVKVLGRAIYQHFDQARLKKYITSHLINADYFNPGTIHPNEINKLMRIASWEK